jgi:hypothetical protein
MLFVRTKQDRNLAAGAAELAVIGPHPTRFLGRAADGPRSAVGRDRSLTPGRGPGETGGDNGEQEHHAKKHMIREDQTASHKK